jgi:hypothetical protein
VRDSLRVSSADMTEPTALPRPEPTPRAIAAIVCRAAALALLAIAVTGCSLAIGPVTTDTPSTPPPTPTPRPTIGIPSPTPQPTFFLYVVKARDTLTSIATHYRTSALSLSYWNKDRYPTLDPDSTDYDPNRIQAGWQLRLVPGGLTDGEDLATPTPVPSPSPVESPSTSPSPSGSS